jgi:L-fuculose-phosphate aldolase
VSLPDELALRQELVNACRVLYATKAAGDGLGGHVSARLDSERILIKPRPASWWTIQPQDFIIINFSGIRVDQANQPRSVMEWPIHTGIYAARADVACVLHAHPVASTLMAALGIAIEPLDQDCTALTDRLPVLNNGAVSIATPALGGEVAGALGEFDAVLLKNHGSVVTGRSFAEMCVTAHKIEKVAETMLRAAALSKLPVMSAEAEATIVAARKGVESSAMIEERWRMLQEYFLGGADV